MRSRTTIALGLTLILGCVSPPGHTSANRVPCGAGQRTKLVLPAGHAYHSAYFSMRGLEDAYTDQWIDDWVAMTGKQPAIIVFSNHWGKNGKLDIRFPTGLAQMMWNHGAVPDIRMMAWASADWTSTGGDPVVTMNRIVKGRFDRALKRWFAAARNLGIPMLIEFGIEVNGSWFPWNGKWNGGGRKDRYGSPRYPDGPERFRDAYRHVHKIADSVGADDLTWVFHPDTATWPDKRWNQPKWYYPGDAYVDWILASAYGEQVPTDDDWYPFTDKMGDPSDPASPYARIRAISPSKPFGVIEFAVTEDPGQDKAQWVTDAYDSMTPPGNLYDVGIASWWSEKWRNGDGSLSDLRVDSSPQVLAAYRNAIADPYFTSTPQWACT